MLHFIRLRPFLLFDSFDYILRLNGSFRLILFTGFPGRNFQPILPLDVAWHFSNLFFISNENILCLNTFLVSLHSQIIQIEI